MTEICHPEWITVTADGSAHKGYDQDWYPRKQQQISGCGPTVGSMMAVCNTSSSRPVQDKMAYGRIESLFQ